MASVSKRTWTSPKGEEKQAWVVRYVDRRGKQRQETFTLKKQADACRRRVEDELLNGTHVSAREAVPIEAACHEFLMLQEDRLSDGAIQPGTLRNAKQAIDVSIIPRLGRKSMTAVTPLDVETFYRDMVRKDGLSPATARARVGYLKSLFDFGLKRSYASRNPAVGALKDIGTARRVRIRVFGAEEVAAVLRLADSRAKGQHDRTWRIARLAIHLAAFCGLRYGEIFGLTVPMVDLDGRVLKIRHSLNSDDVLKDPKTRAGLRDVPMPAHIAELLRAWIVDGYRSNARQLLFRTDMRRSRDQQITAPSFHASYWRPLLKRAGLGTGDRFHFHALRHFAASNMIASGLPVTDTASLLGHEKFDMTLQTYAHPIVNGSRRAALFDAMASDLLALPAPSAAHELRKHPQPIEKTCPKNIVTIVSVSRTSSCGILRP